MMMMMMMNHNAEPVRPQRKGKSDLQRDTHQLSWTRAGRTFAARWRRGQAAAADWTPY